MFHFRDDLDETGLKDDEDEDSLACASDAASTPKRTPAAPPVKGEGEEDNDGKLPFPTASEMNTRLRRIITTYQRDFKKQQLKQQQQAKVCWEIDFFYLYREQKLVLLDLKILRKL